MLNKSTRKKLSVHVQAEASAAGAKEAVVDGDGEIIINGVDAAEAAIEIVGDTFKWKRMQELYPSLC